MAIVSLATLKSYFETGDKPTEAQFVDLIDTLASLPEGLTADQLAAIAGANNPDGSNVFATMLDVPSIFPFSLLAGVPSTTQDSDAGYAVGYIVKNTVNNLLYICTDAAVGAATWELQTNQIVSFALQARQSDIYAGTDIAISECPALPSGYAWEVVSASANLVGTTTPYDGSPDVNIKASTASRQQFYDGQAILAGGTDTFLQLANRDVVAAGGLNPTIVESDELNLSFGGVTSAAGDGTLTVYGTARIIKI